VVHRFRAAFLLEAWPEFPEKCADDLLERGQSRVVVFAEPTEPPEATPRQRKKSPCTECQRPEKPHQTGSDNFVAMHDGWRDRRGINDRRRLPGDGRSRTELLIALPADESEHRLQIALAGTVTGDR